MERVLRGASPTGTSSSCSSSSKDPELSQASVWMLLAGLHFIRSQDPFTHMQIYVNRTSCTHRNEAVNCHISQLQGEPKQCEFWMQKDLNELKFTLSMNLHVIHWTEFQDNRIKNKYIKKSRVPQIKCKIFTSIHYLFCIIYYYFKLCTFIIAANSYF